MVRLRRAAAQAELSDEGQARVAQLRQHILEQERLNYALDIYYQFAGDIGSAWTQALRSIADGTHSVSDAFKEMAKSILQSMSQIASQEAFRALIRIGAGLLTGAVTGQMGVTAPTGTFANTGGFEVMFAQHGAVVNRPTMIMAGEGPSYTKPEFIMNRQQMEGLMSSVGRSGPSAGGQAAGGVTIMNFPSRQAAEDAASRERAMGREVIVNEVLNELSKGESSSINRMIRTLSR